MWRIKNKIRNFVKQLYHKLNPQYRYILHINDVINQIDTKISGLRLDNISNVNTQYDEIKKLYMAEDFINYRYLYLVRYIRENDRVLDVEGGYGTGVNLLSRYTAVDECICLNSINYYTRIGAMYYQSDFLKFQTDCFEHIEEKFNIVTFFDENRTEFLDEHNIIKLGDLVEYDGILAIAFKKSFWKKTHLIEQLKQVGFQVEIRLYQNGNLAELLDTELENTSEIIYLRKNG